RLVDPRRDLKVGVPVFLEEVIEFLSPGLGAGLLVEHEVDFDGRERLRPRRAGAGGQKQDRGGPGGHQWPPPPPWPPVATASASSGTTRPALSISSMALGRPFFFLVRSLQ